MRYINSYFTYLFTYWLGGVVVRALDSRSTGRQFDSRPLHCRATTLGKLFTPMCLCSPSSIIWYFARAFMLKHLYVATIHGSDEQGEYCSSGSAAILIIQNHDINYLLYFTKIVDRCFRRQLARWMRTVLTPAVCLCPQSSMRYLTQHYKKLFTKSTFQLTRCQIPS